MQTWTTKLLDWHAWFWCFPKYKNLIHPVLHRLVMMPPVPKCLPTFLDVAHPQTHSQIVHSYLLRTCIFLLVLCAVVFFGLQSKDFCIPLSPRKTTHKKVVQCAPLFLRLLKWCVLHCLLVSNKLFCVGEKVVHGAPLLGSLVSSIHHYFQTLTN